MMKLGRIPLFTQEISAKLRLTGEIRRRFDIAKRFGRGINYRERTAEEFRAEAQEIIRDRLIADIQSGRLPLKPPPFEFEHHPWMKEMAGEEEENEETGSEAQAKRSEPGSEAP